MGYALSTSCNIIGNAGISLSHAIRVGISDSRCTGDHRVTKQVQKLDGYAHPIKIFTYQALGGVKTSLTLYCKEGLVNLKVFRNSYFTDRFLISDYLGEIVAVLPLSNPRLIIN